MTIPMSSQTAIEQSLLDSHWRPSTSHELCQAAVQGHFQQVCLLPGLHTAFWVDATTQLPVLHPDGIAPLELLALGVACLHAYVQSNWTGPDLAFDPLELFEDAQGVSSEELQEASILALTYSGEPIYHLARHAPLLLMARLIFFSADSPLQHLPSLPVWQLRTDLVHLRCLDEPVQLPTALLDAVEGYRDVLKQLPDELDLMAAQTLLLGHYHRVLSSVVPSSERQASLLFLQAAQEAGLEWEVTGVLGKRTKFQLDDKAQLVVLAQSRERAASQADERPDQPVTLPLNDDTLLEKTLFTASSDSTRLAHLDPNHQPDLHPFDQALLLSLSFNHANESPGHGLTTAQVAAFVARCLDKSNNWSVHSMALLLRSRLEAARTRTVERGVLQMQSLVDQLKLEAQAPSDKQETGAAAAERLRYFHALALPPKWDLERELAGRYLNIGVTKSALEIYTRLEMWEEAARCLVSIGQKEKAVQLVQDLLSGAQSESQQVMRVRRDEQRRMDPQRQAKLHCILGELTRDVEHFHKAWDISGHRSARAMRSLGGAFFSQKRWAECSEALRRSLAINPLNFHSWFIVGCSDMKREAWPEAEEAFGRCVALDDDDAESWTNLASTHLRLADNISDGGDAKVSLDRKRAAFQCLKQAIKVDRSSWKIWTNYMVVAVSVGELADACRALRTLVELRADKVGEKAVDLQVLERLVDAVTRETAAEISPEQARGLSARVSELFDDTLLPRFSNSPRIFKAHARLSLWQGNYDACLADHLQAYRCIMQESGIDTDLPKFRDAAQEVDEIVSIWQSLSSQGKIETGNWKSQCRSMIRSFLGRTKDSFEDEEAYGRLKELSRDL